ncbi:alpha/beta hydrolase [Spirosoma panaciterrae]|uniref:alpha/beta hydrolase n=1 Tax=Spirosoma panaciterrae TaxID=496058 RepID=UPI00037E80B9|nr:alpha/beta hydrolase [Spirosoma panaciterrae]
MSLLRLLWQIPLVLIALVAVLILVNEYAIARSSRRTKDITYRPANAPGFDAERNSLDVYAPTDNPSGPKPVVVFIHGGSWNSGNKNIYAFIGRRLAKQGVVAVLINYRLAPAVEVPDMAADCAQAVHWVMEHIAEYGGDSSRIFLMGHSAGGGLAALLASDDQILAKVGMTHNPIKGVILDDPAGLDMFDYLSRMDYPDDEHYLIPFGKKPDIWRSVSALYSLTAHTPPMLVYVGDQTYPSIIKSTRRFLQRLQELGVTHEFTRMPNKKHVGMVTQLFWKNNVIYRDLLAFVNARR